MCFFFIIIIFRLLPCSQYNFYLYEHPTSGESYLPSDNFDLPEEICSEVSDDVQDKSGPLIQITSPLPGKLSEAEAPSSDVTASAGVDPAGVLRSAAANNDPIEDSCSETNDDDVQTTSGQPPVQIISPGIFGADNSIFGFKYYPISEEDSQSTATKVPEAYTKSLVDVSQNADNAKSQIAQNKVEKSYNRFNRGTAWKKPASSNIGSEKENLQHDNNKRKPSRVSRLVSQYDNKTTESDTISKKRSADECLPNLRQIKSPKNC